MREINDYFFGVSLLVIPQTKSSNSQSDRGLFCPLIADTSIFFVAFDVFGGMNQE
jgi:hypothetical protein